MGQANPIGLIAGWGNFPVEVAERLRSEGRETCIVGLAGHADEGLKDYTKNFEWKGVLKVGAHIRFFKKHNVRSVVLAGKIFKDKILYQGLGWIQHLPDWTCYRVLGGSFVTHSSDGRDDTVLGAIVREYERQNMRVLPITDVARDLLVPEGTLTKRKIRTSALRDAEFGWKIARQMGAMDIGQSITVKDQIVLGVEAIEGTDALIARTGRLCPVGGFTLIKIAKPNQDMRFDVPTIGSRTVEQMARAGGNTIVVEAGRTLLIDRDETLELANDRKVGIVAFESRIASNPLSDLESSETLTVTSNAARRAA